MGTQVGGRRHITERPFEIDDSACTILHVDMDAFFAAVELLARPDLRGLPMMVAGGDRGVVLSATYEARRFGVRSAMPSAQARALCPGIAIVRPNHGAYQDASRKVMNIFAQVTPLVEPLSVDEAFLDISGATRISGRPAAIAGALRTRISVELGLTATIGAASTKFVAKLASGLAKPDGLLIVPPADVQKLLRPLPVRALWGVGPKTAISLQALGLNTVGEVADTGRDALIRALGQATGGKLHDLANGLDARDVHTENSESSIGNETTFEVDVVDRRRLDRELLGLTERTARRARTARVKGRTVALKVKFADFTIVTRSLTLATPSDLPGVIHATAVSLLDRVFTGSRRIRLLGIRLEGLVPAEQVSEQLELGTGPDRPGWREAEGALDLVSARFGARAVRRATLVERPERPRKVDLPIDFAPR